MLERKLKVLCGPPDGRHEGRKVAVALLKAGFLKEQFRNSPVESEDRGRGVALEEIGKQRKG